MISGKLIYLGAIAVAVLANVTANIALKMAMAALVPGSPKAKIFQLLELVSFWVGLCAAGLLLVSYLVALRSGPVSVAYITVTSLAMVGLVFVEKSFFGSSIEMAKILGVCLVISGMILVTKNT